MIPKIHPSRKDAGSPKILVEYLFREKNKHRDDIEAEKADHGKVRVSSFQIQNSGADHGSEFWKEVEARRHASRQHDRDTVYHLNLSTYADDQASDEQLIQAGRRVLRDLGLGEHAALFVIHRDTDHPHIHVVADLVHPSTLKKVARPSHDFRRSHLSCRQIEAENGWKRDEGCHWSDREFARLNNQPEPQKPDHSKKSAGASDRDAHNPGQSFQSRIEGNEALERIFKDSSSWLDLQSRLAEYGQNEFSSDLIYVRSGSGAILQLADDPNQRGKASLVHHTASLSKLEKRFGPLPQTPIPAAISGKPAKSSPKASSAKPATLPDGKSKDPFYDRYTKAKEGHQARKDDTKATKDALRARHKAEMDALKKLQYAERRQLFREIADHQSRRFADSARALKAAQVREGLDIAHSNERRTLAASTRFPSWREWLSAQAMTDPKAAERLARMKEPVKPADLKPKISSVLSDVTTSQNADGSIHYQKNNETISVDLGEMMKLMKTDDSSILANLRIAQAKFGSLFDIKAKDIDKYIRVAALNGIYISTLTDQQQEKWKAIREEEFAKYRTKPKPEKPETDDSSSAHHRRNRHQQQENANESDGRPIVQQVHLRREQDKNQCRSRSRGRDEGR